MAQKSHGRGGGETWWPPCAGAARCYALGRRQADYQPLLTEFPYVLPRGRFHE